MGSLTDRGGRVSRGPARGGTPVLVKAPDLCMKCIRSFNPLRGSKRGRGEKLWAWRLGWFFLRMLQKAS